MVRVFSIYSYLTSFKANFIHFYSFLLCLLLCWPSFSAPNKKKKTKKNSLELQIHRYERASGRQLRPVTSHNSLSVCSRHHQQWCNLRHQRGIFHARSRINQTLRPQTCSYRSRRDRIRKENRSFCNDLGYPTTLSRSMSRNTLCRMKKKHNDHVKRLGGKVSDDTGLSLKFKNRKLRLKPRVYRSFEEQDVVDFNRIRTNPNGDCGFEAINISRLTAIRLLLERGRVSLSIRELVAPMIIESFQIESWIDRVHTEREISNYLTRIIGSEASNSQSILDGFNSVLESAFLGREALNSSLLEFVSSEEVFSLYISNYIGRRIGHDPHWYRGWMTVDILAAFSEILQTPIYIYQRDRSASSRNLELIRSLEPTIRNPSVQEIYLLHGSSHYDRLMPIRTFSRSSSNIASSSQFFREPFDGSRSLPLLLPLLAISMVANQSK